MTIKIKANDIGRKVLLKTGEVLEIASFRPFEPFYKVRTEDGATFLDNGRYHIGTASEFDIVAFADEATTQQKVRTYFEAALESAMENDDVDRVVAVIEAMKAVGLWGEGK